MKTSFKVVGAFLGLFALVGAISAGNLAWRYITAEPRGIVEGEEQIQSGASRIQRYEHFFDLCSTIQGMEDKIDAQRQLEQTDRVQRNIAALISQRNASIRRYNTDARQDYTSGQFRDSDLPYQLNAGQYEGPEDKTSCQ